jgi:phage gp36-like protein
VNYCTLVDVRTALNGTGATSGSNTAADLPDPAITDAIAEASAEVDAYIGGPYAVSEAVPAVIKFWTRNIAAYMATLTWRKSMAILPTDPVAIRYTNTIAMLILAQSATSELDFPMPADVLETADIENHWATTVFDSLGNPVPLFDIRQFRIFGHGRRDDVAWAANYSTWADDHWGWP